MHLKENLKKILYILLVLVLCGAVIVSWRLYLKEKKLPSFKGGYYIGDYADIHRPTLVIFPKGKKSEKDTFKYIYTPDIGKQTHVVKGRYIVKSDYAIKLENSKEDMWVFYQRGKFYLEKEGRCYLMHKVSKIPFRTVQKEDEVEIEK